MGLDTAAVVHAAAELADANGLERLTLSAVAARLRVRSPSLYAHVDGLSDLHARLATRGAQALHEALAPAAAGRSGSDALREVAAAYRDFAAAHPGLYAAALRAGSSGEAAAAAAARSVALMRAVLRGYGLTGEAADHAVRGLWAALHGFVALERGGGFGMALDVDESWERLLDTLDRGLGGAGAR